MKHKKMIAVLISAFCILSQASMAFAEEEPMLTKEDVLEEEQTVEPEVVYVEVEEEAAEEDVAEESLAEEAVQEAEPVYEEVVEDYVEESALAITASVNGAEFTYLSDAVNAAQNGDTIVLKDDCMLNATLTVAKDIVIDLNGFTICNESEIWDEEMEQYALISIDGGSLTMKDTSNEETGSVEALEDDCYAFEVKNDGTLDIESGTYIGNITVVYVESGMLIISGGEFDIRQLSDSEGYKYMVYADTQAFDDGDAEIVIGGGTFNGWNASDVSPSYLADGYTAVEKESGKYTVEIHEHTPVAIEGEEASCEEDGLTEGTVCSECGERLVEQEIIPATGHDYEWQVITEASEGVEGLEQEICTICGDVNDERIIEALEADDADAQESSEEESEEAADDEEIIEEADKDIDEETIEEDEDIDDEFEQAVSEETDETDEDEDDEFELQADAGLMVLSTTEEEEEDTEQDSLFDAPAVLSAENEEEETPKTTESETEAETEHTHVPAVLEGYPATCTENGLTNGTYCEICGEIIEPQEVIPALGHEIIEDAAVEATCTEAGKTAGSHCERCGEILEKQESIPALGHEVAVDEAKAATCTEDGLTEGTHCERCGEILEKQEGIPALGHEAVEDPEVEATCTEDGLTEGSHCERCGEILEKQEVIPALGHEYDEEILVEPTCTEEGRAKYTCSVCGYTYEDVIPANGHTWEWVTDKEATETEEGERHQVCTVCGEEGEHEVIPMLATEDEEAVQTGDDTPLLFALSISVMSMIVIAGSVMYLFRRREHN